MVNKIVKDCFVTAFLFVNYVKHIYGSKVKVTDMILSEASNFHPYCLPWSSPSFFKSPVLIFLFILLLFLFEFSHCFSFKKCTLYKLACTLFFPLNIYWWPRCRNTLRVFLFTAMMHFNLGNTYSLFPASVN